MRSNPKKFAVLGAEHPHINLMLKGFFECGALPVVAYSETKHVASQLAEQFPGMKTSDKVDEILSDESIDFVLGAAIPCHRADYGIRTMKAGKDYLCAKPGMIQMDELKKIREVHRETSRFYSIFFSERLLSLGTGTAFRLLREGAIGQPVLFTGLGPHLLRANTRPEWFWNPERAGGILTDIASHQFEQFLLFCGGIDKKVSVDSSRVGNLRHPEYARFQDYGDVCLSCDGVAGHIRVDWFSPSGLPTWGDARLFLSGTEGSIEIRKNIDLDGQPGGEHVFLVNQEGVRRIQCAGEPSAFFEQWLDDLQSREERVMPTKQSLRAMELALLSQEYAGTIKGQDL